MSHRRNRRAPYLRSRSTGAGFAFCGTVHLNSWLLFRRGNLDDYIFHGLSKDTCAYCLVCGKRVNNTRCRLHDTNCPESDQFHRYGATVVPPIVAAELGRDLTDADYLHIFHSIDNREPSDQLDDIATRALNHIRAETGECQDSE